MDPLGLFVFIGVPFVVLGLAYVAVRVFEWHDDRQRREIAPGE